MYFVDHSRSTYLGKLWSPCGGDPVPRCAHTDQACPARQALHVNGGRRQQQQLRGRRRRLRCEQRHWRQRWHQCRHGLLLLLRRIGGGGPSLEKELARMRRVSVGDRSPPHILLLPPTTAFCGGRLSCPVVVRSICTCQLVVIVSRPTRSTAKYRRDRWGAIAVRDGFDEKEQIVFFRQLLGLLTANKNA